MNYPQMVYFLKAAEKSSFSEAAKELFISPQALSHQIAQLEHELGTSLFERSTRRIRLTATGVFCQMQFAAAKEAVDRALASVKQEIERLNRIIRIAFFNGLPKNDLVTPALAKLQRCCADCQLDLTSGGLAAVFQALDDAKIDLLLTNIADDTDMREYQHVVLHTKPAKIVMSDCHPWAGREQITAEELRQAPMLQFSRIDRPAGHNFYHDLGNTAVKYVSDFDTMLAILENGRHVAVFPQSFDFCDRARFKYLELPVQFQFNFQTVLMAKKSPSKNKVNEILTRFTNCD